MTEMESRYDHAKETDIYKNWEDSGYFSPDICEEKGLIKKDAETFSIVLPPPNVTGTLHIGHAFEDTFQDIAVRYARMSGKRTLWIPGTDHAAIATQSKVEKLLQKEEGKSKYDLGRENFLERVSDFAKKSHDTIVTQIRRLGASLDWNREAYTLDEPRNLAVRTAFKRMYDLGLIYRGYRVVNWDPKGQTVISDDEIVYEEREAPLYTFRYAKDFPIPISTTRPETKVGDTAVAVHPNDPRYSAYIGKEYDVIFSGVPLHIKIIADESVEKDFGTGALGVTPAHSIIDWELAQKHNLPLAPVIDERAKMTIPGTLNGKKTLEAREEIIAWLRAEGLLEKEEMTKQNVSTAERTGAIIEPLPKLQWFVAVNKPFILEQSKINGVSSGSTITLKELMRKMVESKQITIIPDRFLKIYFHWIENLRDWCISRQLWFGHRIPAWYRPKAGPGGSQEVYVGIEPPTEEGWQQDEDTLDTWFSSGMWTFSTLGWPFFAKATKGRPGPENDFETYHPNTLMAPGYEILFFWVARMILMSGCLLGDIPFKTVCLHGMVRDKNGKKFSKSLGNGIDPLELANTYGADAVRMALIAGAAPGNDVKFDESRVRGYRNFATKIWNAARFILMNKPTQNNADGTQINAELNDEQKSNIETCKKVKAEVGTHIEQFEFHLGAEKAYHYFWHTFADKIIEGEKATLKGNDENAKAASYRTLETILRECLIMLHPFIPFVTEAVWQEMGNSSLLMVEQWE